MKLPRKPKTAAEAKAKQEVVGALGRFAEMFELAMRAKKVGLVPVKVLGCNPSAADITREQLDRLRQVVEQEEVAVEQFGKTEVEKDAEIAAVLESWRAL